MNPPNYVALDFSDPTDLSQLYPQSRREFLKAGAALGAGLMAVSTVIVSSNTRLLGLKK